MPEIKNRLYRRSCVVCSVDFVSRCTNAKYCDKCRDHANYLVAKKSRQARSKQPKPEKPQIMVYTCVRCDRSIKAYGRCTNRKICDECLLASGTRDDYVLLMQRKEVREEVVNDV